MVMVSAALAGGEKLSETRIVTGYIPGPCTSAGVQVKMPVLGSIAAPVGGPGSRVKVRVCLGKSASVAETVNVKRVPSFTVLSPRVANTGGVFTSLTVMVMVSVALAG